MKLTFKTLVGPLCITLALWGLTGVYWQNVEQETVAKRALALGHAADNAQALLRQRLLRFELVLRGAKGFYEGSEFVTRAEFKRYIQTLQLDATKVGLQGIAIALRVDHADKQLHTAEMQRRGFSPYQVKPEGVRAQYTPIVLIEPLDAINERALGFDIATNPVARQALDQSLLTGKEVITGQLALAQDAGQNRPAVVMYLPLLAEGSNAVVGWVSGPFRIQDLLDAIAPQMDPDIDIAIFDGASSTPANRLYGSDRSGVAEPEVRQLDIGGRHWTLWIHATPEFEARYSNTSHSFVAVIGVVASLLLGFVYWLMGTGRARATELAQEMTHELRGLHAAREATLSAIPDLLFEVDEHGCVLAYHARRNDLLAAPPEVFMGKNFADFLPAPATEVCMAALRKAAVAGYDTGAVYSLTLAQGETWFELSVSALPNTEGAAQRFILLARDITARKTAESALKASNAQLQLLETCVSRLNDIVLITEAEPFSEPGPRIVFVNDAFERRTGYTREEVIGKSPRILQGPKTDRKELDRIRTALERWEPVRAELLNYTKSGEEFWIELDIVPIADATGWYTHWVAVERDVTERKQTQADLQISLREKTALLLEVHHRVKNNLQVITSLLRLEGFRSTDAPTKAVLQDMQARVRSMALLHEMVYRKGTFAAIDLGKYLGQIAGESLKSLQIAPGAVHLRLEFSELQVGLDQASPAGMLISELVSNSLKHGFPKDHTGEISITLHPLDGQGHWRLCISDSGVGFPADFESRRKGSLGLQLAGDMAAQMGGALQVGGGPQAVFTVDFKAHAPAPIVINVS